MHWSMTSNIVWSHRVRGNKVIRYTDDANSMFDNPVGIFFKTKDASFYHDLYNDHPHLLRLLNKFRMHIGYNNRNDARTYLRYIKTYIKNHGFIPFN